MFVRCLVIDENIICDVELERFCTASAFLLEDGGRIVCTSGESSSTFSDGLHASIVYACAEQTNEPRFAYLCVGG